MKWKVIIIDTTENCTRLTVNPKSTKNKYTLLSIKYRTIRLLRGIFVQFPSFDHEFVMREPRHRVLR